MSAEGPPRRECTPSGAAKRHRPRASHELVAEAPAAADQAHARRARKRSRKGCGSSARRARPCCTAPTSRTISTCARSAGITSGSPRASASSSCSTRKAASRSAPRSCRSTASSSRTEEVSRPPRGCARGHGRDRCAHRHAGSVKSVPLVSPRSSSSSWAGRWARSWASASCAACAWPTRTACRSCAFPLRAARACRKASAR